MQILLDFRPIRFKFHDRINQWLISFQSAISKIVQGDKRFYVSWRSVKLCLNSNKHPRLMQGSYFRSHVWSAYQHVQISQGLLIDLPNHLLYAQHYVQISQGLPIDVPNYLLYFLHAQRRIQISQGLLIDVPNHLLYFLHVHHCEWKKGLPIDAPYNFYYFQHVHHRV
jgi:hypothetical protein